MKKGIVKVNLVYLKNGGYAYKGEVVTENDILNFTTLVTTGKIEVVKKEIVKKEISKPEVKKPTEKK